MVQGIRTPISMTGIGLRLSRGHLVQAIAELTPQDRLSFSMHVLAVGRSPAGTVILIVQGIRNGRFEYQQRPP